MSDMNTPEVPAEAVAPEAPAEAPAEPVAATEATPVVARTPSSESETQQPESAPGVEAEPIPLEDAVRALLIFVKARRIVGDADLDAALADVEAALPAQP